MSIETLASFLFLILLGLFLIVKRKEVAIQKILWPVVYMAMYRTKLGLKQMDSLAKKHPKLIDRLSKLGVYVGFAGMFAISYLLIKSVFDTFLVPDAPQSVSLVVPFKAAGTVYIPFFYWIISIFIIAGIHEFSHGVVARLHGVKIKSSGFAFLGILLPIIPAAFVEPDEKQLTKKKRMQKLSVYSAGPFSNILSGFLFLALLLLVSIPSAQMFEPNGVQVEGYTKNSSAEKVGLQRGEIIQKINGIEIMSVENLSNTLKTKKIGEILDITTNNNTHKIELGVNPQNSSQPYLGVLISQSKQTNPKFETKYGRFTAPAIEWFLGLLSVLFVLSIGIGLINWAPVWIFDGGQMSREMFGAIFKKETTAKKWWNMSSLILLIVLLSLIFSPAIKSLFGFFFRLVI